MSISKDNTVAAINAWATRDNYQHGYWVTLDAVSFGEWTLNRIDFEHKLGKFSNRLNSYCYGRAYRGGKKRLRIVGAIEFGQFTEREHAHLLVLHDQHMRRTFAEVEEKIRRSWYSIMGAKGSYRGNLVDVQPIGDARSRLDYALKHHHTKYDKYSRVVIL
jgi:hypothetical protein